jgi:hypothetical protein
MGSVSALHTPVSIATDSDALVPLTKLSSLIFLFLAERKELIFYTFDALASVSFSFFTTA